MNNKPIELPELPDTNYNGYADGSEPLYTVDQMRAYATEAVKQALERQGRTTLPSNSHRERGDLSDIENPTIHAFPDGPDHSEHGLDMVEQPNSNSARDSGAHYRYNYRGVKLDPYRIISVYGITNPAHQHALKKLLRAGRSVKSERQDIREVIDSLSRWLEMIDEDALAEQPADREVVAVTHTCEDDFQHFLSTHGYLATAMRREAFEAAWSPSAPPLDESQSWKESAYALRDQLSVALEELAALKADLLPPDEQGQWVNCSPSLLNAGVSCANTPRRASKDPCNSHDHFIAWCPSPQPPAIVACCTSLSRVEFHDAAWAIYHAKTLDDSMLAKMSIHSMRAMFDAIYDALPKTSPQPLDEEQGINPATEKELFEKSSAIERLWLSQMLEWSDLHSRYIDVRTNNAWIIWQAARAGRG